MKEEMRVRVGLISRIDYGLASFRRDLIRVVLDRFEEEKVDFIVVVGGLVDRKFKLKDYIKLEQSKADHKFKHEEIVKLAESFFALAKKNLSDVFRPITIGDKVIKYYIVTSPVHDKALGEELAGTLAQERKDIDYKGSRRGTFEIRGFNGKLVVLTPHKAAWLRGDYFSTPVQRVVSDELKITKKTYPLVFAIGCFGVAMYKPGGDSCNEPVSYCGVPSISESSEIDVQDNHVGCAIVEFNKTEDGERVSYKVCGLKDSLANERNYLNINYLNQDEKRIIKAFQTFETAPTIGQLEDHSGIKREKIEEIINGSKRLKSIIRKSIDGKKFVIHMSDIVKYPKVTVSERMRILAFGCLHAGCRWTDYWFYRTRLPLIVAEKNIDYIVGIGDFTESIEHDLILSGEVIGGMNNTAQEELSADVTADMLFTAFMLKSGGKSKIDLGDIEKHFPYFIFIAGNHCAFSLRHGYEPLRIFKSRLVDQVLNKIYPVFSNHNHAKMVELIKSKILELDVHAPIYATKSSARLSLHHPYLARNKTLSVRAQEVNAKVAHLGSIINFIANFHIHFMLQSWAPKQGDVVAVQVGTLKVNSRYEGLKNKSVDFGVADVEVGLTKDRRVAYSKTTYHTKPTGKLISNADILEFIRRKIFNS